MLARYDVLEVIIYAHGGRLVPRLVDGAVSEGFVRHGRSLFDIRHYKEAVRQIK